MDKADSSRFDTTIGIRILPNSTVAEDIAHLWPEASSATETLRARLAEDVGRTLFSLGQNGDGLDELRITTPRLRLRGFVDRRRRETLIVKRIQTGSVTEWRRDSRRGIPIHVRWAVESEAPSSRYDLQALVEHLRMRSDQMASPGAFWEFWGEYLDVERELLDRLREHPGWPYDQRRYGVSGTIEFHVAEAWEEIQNRCRGRILLEIQDQSGYVFELRNVQSTLGWIAGAPLDSAVGVAVIPSIGRIKPDWWSASSLFQRRKRSLDVLRRGEGAMLQLGSILPYGPQTEVPGRPFEARIRTDYNDGQRTAIEKALAAESVTCIQGPPGTGKTAVIAEIAVQVASQGRRVLVASQANLAVDNALERIANVDDIFAVRVGRPESVRLNPELLLDRASERYRARLQRRSRTRWEQEREWHDRVVALWPSAAEIQSAANDALTQIQAAQQAGAAQNLLQSVKARLEEALALLQSVEEEFRRGIAAAGIDIQQLAHLKEIDCSIAQLGWDSATIANRAEEIAWAYEHRGEIAVLADYVTQCSTAEHEIKRAAQTASIWSSQLQHLAQLETELARRESRNAEIERKRTSTSGFFSWLDANVFSWKDDTDELRTEIRKIDRGQATIGLRDAEARQNLLRNQCVRNAAAIADGLACLGIEVHELERNARVLSLAHDLKYAQFLAAKNGLILAPKLKYVPGLCEKEECVSRATIQSELASRRHDEQAANAAATASRLDEILGRRGRDRLLDISQRMGISSQSGLDLPTDFTEAAIRDACALLLQEYRKGSERLDRFGALQDALHWYHSRLDNSNIDLEEGVLAEANLVAATCTGIAAARDFQGQFDLVIIDESGRAMPLDLLIPMVRGKSIVLVGDHRQLPPAIDPDLEDLLQERGLDDPALSQSLFEKLFTSIHSSRKESLQLQYRMVPEICRIVKALSYPDLDLQPAGAALLRRHPFSKVLETPISWVKCSGPKNRATGKGGRGQSPHNEAEVLAIVSKLKQFAGCLLPTDAPCQIGVISMYRGQVAELDRAIASAGLREHCNIQIELGTVDAFQGREKDAVIVSLVETDPNRRRFFYDVRRVNVAISRPRSLLIMVGEVDVLGRRPTVPNDSRIANPLHCLWGLLRSGISDGSVTTEVFHAE
jgi:RecA/RadA recombinase